MVRMAERRIMGRDDRIESLAETWGADFFGVADLSLARDAI